MQQGKNEKPRASNGEKPPEYEAEAVRGGRIILRTRAQRIVFIAGLAGIVELALLIRIVAHG